MPSCDAVPNFSSAASLRNPASEPLCLLPSSFQSPREWHGQFVTLHTDILSHTHTHYVHLIHLRTYKGNKLPDTKSIDFHQNHYLLLLAANFNDLGSFLKNCHLTDVNTVVSISMLKWKIYFSWLIIQKFVFLFKSFSSEFFCGLDSLLPWFSECASFVSISHETLSDPGSDHNSLFLFPFFSFHVFILEEKLANLKMVNIKINVNSRNLSSGILVTFCNGPTYVNRQETRTQSITNNIH